VLGGALNALCSDALTRWGVPGAAVGVLAGGEAECEAFGVADVRTGEPVRSETTFRIASITKPFTATLALSLVEEGLLALEEPVSVALPDGGVTLRHLLAHLGGFEGEAGDLSRFGEGDDALPRLMAELREQRQVVPPGTVWSYCNAGYWAAGFLCAERLGTTYEDALRARVLEALGLAATSFGEPEAAGHVQPEPGSPSHEPAPSSTYPRARRPSGGLVSNASDLLRFAAFQLGEERAERLREPQAETPDGAYGLGLALDRVGGLDVWDHRGAYGGFKSRLALIPERETAFVVLTNGDAGDTVIREISDALLAELCSVRRQEPPTVSVEAGELELLKGRYTSPEVEADIDVADSSLLLDLVATLPNGSRQQLPRFPARPIGKRVFALVGGQWDGERFDFVPGGGPPRFVRLGGRLVERR
jgi:CubicO group peptidase (beta-lactamase class C family)